jgi:hypothetical protein
MKTISEKDIRLANIKFIPSDTSVPVSAVLRCLIEGIVALQDKERMNDLPECTEEKVK